MPAQFFRGFKSNAVFACHCWVSDKQIQIGILIIKDLKLCGQNTQLKDCDSQRNLIVALPSNTIAVILNTTLEIVDNL